MNPQLQIMLQQAMLAFQGSNFDRATSILIKILQNDSKCLPALHVLGLIKATQENYKEAADYLDRAVRLNPNDASLRYNLAKALIDCGFNDKSIAHHKRALELEPDNPEILLNYAKTLASLEHFDEALELLDRAANIAPNHVGIWVNKGNILHALNNYEEANATFGRALEINPENAVAWTNKAISLEALGRLDEALFAYDCATKVDHEYISAHWNKSNLKLSLGDYLSGWELFEWRWKTKAQKNSFRQYPQPLWLGGESLKDKRILIWSEQGLGDSIQFCRYIKMVSNLGAKVIFEVQESLLSLFSSLDGVHQVIAMGSKSPDFDFHCPLMSLPLAFKTSIDTIPNQVPYIRPDKNKTLFWEERLDATKKFRVGLVWSSGFRPDHPELWKANAKRDVSLSLLAKINLPDVAFYSLQKGDDGEKQLAVLKESPENSMNIIDFTQELSDFSDTAALIAALDLIISVDTSVAHMAGALGKPVWVLNHHDSCWRWLRNKNPNPWYPTAKIFNQLTRGDWNPVVEEVKRCLKSLTLSAH
jgi:Flp pilus assembly protein TadD